MDRRLVVREEDREHIEKLLKLAESEEQCLKGWGPIEDNYDGCCCCNCIYQQPINGHPWNKNTLVKTMISQVVGWGCNPPDLNPNITFFETPHGMCEMYSRGK